MLSSVVLRLEDEMVSVTLKLSAFVAVLLKPNNLAVASLAAFLSSLFFHNGEYGGLLVGVGLVGKTGTLRPLTHNHGVCRVYVILLA